MVCECPQKAQFASRVRIQFTLTQLLQVAKVIQNSQVFAPLTPFLDLFTYFFTSFKVFSCFSGNLPQETSHFRHL